jgi:tryptophanyl-tRNA synthetase
MAASFNHLYGPHFTLPEAAVDESVATLPGLDGRKMSKSYDNIISLFEGGTRALADSIARIVTDSRLPGEPKNIDNCALVTLHDAFASPEQRAQFHADLSQGMGWGEAKKLTAQRIELQIAPMRDQYAALMSKPAELEAILQEGAAKARQIATPFMADIRQAVGLKSFVSCATTTPPPSGASASSHKTAAPVFKQYREADGLFYFKLTAADGVVLLQSHGFEQGREAGAWVKRLKTQGPSTLADVPSNWYAGVQAYQLTAALQTLQALENETLQ